MPRGRFLEADLTFKLDPTSSHIAVRKVKLQLSFLSLTIISSILRNTVKMYVQHKNVGALKPFCTSNTVVPIIPNLRKTAILNSINYFKALPPEPPLSLHVQQSSSIYSLATEPYSPQLLTPSIVDFSAQLTIEKSSRSTLQSLQTSRPLIPVDTDTNNLYSPSSIKAEPSTPTTTTTSDSSLLVPVACRLSWPFAPRIPRKQGNIIIEEDYPRNDRVASLRSAIPKTDSDTEKDTAIALSSVYQHYFENEGETG
jgi:hypothetical protein